MECLIIKKNQILNNTFGAIRGIEENFQPCFLKFINRGLCGVRTKVVTEQDIILPIILTLLFQYSKQPFVEPSA